VCICASISIYLSIYRYRHRGHECCFLDLVYLIQRLFVAAARFYAITVFLKLCASILWLTLFLKVLFGITDKELKILDEFEDEQYRRETVKTILMVELISAYSYACICMHACMYDVHMDVYFH
jgi:hypothetical protein